MTNGLGAGFFALAVLATLAGVAGLLVVAGGVGLLVGDGERVHRRFQQLVVALLGVVAVVSGFGVLSLVDEALQVAGLVAGVVAIPLLAVGARARTHATVASGGERAVDWVGVVAAAALAWSAPFLLSVAVLAGLTIRTDLPPIVVGPLSVLVALAGALALGEYTTRLVAPSTSPTS